MEIKFLACILLVMIYIFRVSFLYFINLNTPITLPKIVQSGTMIDVYKRQVIQEDAKDLPYMHVSGGKLGMQLTLAPLDLAKAANAEFADIIHRP